MSIYCWYTIPFATQKGLSFISGDRMLCSRSVYGLRVAVAVVAPFNPFPPKSNNSMVFNPHHNYILHSQQQCINAAKIYFFSSFLRFFFRKKYTPICFTA